MSQADTTTWRDLAADLGISPECDPEDLSNEELLRAVGSLDPDEFPIAEKAQTALDQLEESSA